MALKITLDPGHGQYGNKSPPQQHKVYRRYADVAFGK